MQAKKQSGTPSAASSTSKQPDQFRLFLDESLDSDSVATALRAAGAHVERLTDHFAKGTPDEVWLERAGRESWIVLTRDKRIRYRKLERIALKMAGVRAYFAWGFGGQFIFVVPALDLAIASTSAATASDDRRSHRLTVDALIERLVVAPIRALAP